MKILITGSNGYIGKALQKHYADHELTLLNRKTCDLLSEQMIDMFFQDDCFYDIVIHCAASGGSRLKKDSPDALTNNLKMFF